MTPSALDGLVVADFSRVLSAPYATMLLGDLGATVVKVERPGTGDETRAWAPPSAHGQATYFQSVNRNKRSIALDLSDASDRGVAVRLVERADVLVENFRPGTMRRFGLDYPSLRPAHPRLVYCSISGFGTGPGAALPGFDLLVQAVGGLMSVTGEAGGPPLKTGVAVADVLTGLHAVTGILAALHHRHRTGEGQLVEVDLLSCLLSSLVNQAAGHVLADVTPQRMGNHHPSLAPYELFATADATIVVAVGNDRQFRVLCDALGLRDLADDPRFVTNTRRVEHAAALHAALEEVLVTRDAREWQAALNAAGVPCGPVNSVAQAFALAEELRLGPVSVLPDGRPTTSDPLRLDRTPVRYHRPPPDLDADADWLMEWMRGPA